TRGAGDDELGRVNRGIGLQVIDDARRAPSPGADEAPVVARVRGEESCRSVRPGAVGESKAVVFAAVSVVEGDVRVAMKYGLVRGSDAIGAAISKAAAAAVRCWSLW